MRIDAKARLLGTTPRHPRRYGRRVTQEELSEAVGISRQWYAELELGRDVRVSPVVLGRLADTLGMTTAEREELFGLAIPELTHAALSSESEALIQIASLRPLVRRLWSATTEAEALALLLEDCSMRFPGIELAMSDHRLAEGRREFPVTFGASEVRERLAELGASGMFSVLYPELPAAPELGHELRRCGVCEATFLVSYVRSTRNYEATISLYRDASHSAFSEAEIWMFGAVAEIASLALGGTVGTA